MVPPSSPVEIDAALSDLFRHVNAAFAEGDPDRGLELADDLWGRIPEPKVAWDYFFQRVPHTVATSCVEAGRLDAAGVWLDRAYAAYGRLSSEGAQTLDFLRASLLYRADQSQAAFAIFDAIQRASGRWRFAGAPAVYWEFYDEARRDGRFDQPSPDQPLLDQPPQPWSPTEAQGAHASPEGSPQQSQPDSAISPETDHAPHRGEPTASEPSGSAAEHADPQGSAEGEPAPAPSEQPVVPPLGDGRLAIQNVGIGADALQARGTATSPATPTTTADPG